MFPKEIRLQANQTMPYSPQFSPHKSQFTINDSNSCSFEDIPVQKQRAMSHKKLSIVSSSYKNQGTPCRPELANIDLNKYYRNPSKNNLILSHKKATDEKDQKYSLKNPAYINFNNNKKQFVRQQSNQNINQKADIRNIRAQTVSCIQKISQHFNTQFQKQSQMIQNLCTKIKNLQKQLDGKTIVINNLQNLVQASMKNYLFMIKKYEDIQARGNLYQEQCQAQQILINNKIEQTNEIIGNIIMRKLFSMECNVQKFVDQHTLKINLMQNTELKRSAKIRQLKDNLDLIDGIVSKMEDTCTKSSIGGSNWEELSDFVPNFGNNSRMNNFSTLSFASEEYFFHPKNQTIQEAKQNKQNSIDEDYESKRSPQKYSQSNLESNLKKIIKILEVYDDTLPCLIDCHKKIVNMMTNQYLVDEKGLQFIITNEQELDYLVECGYIKILRRYDCNNHTNPSLSAKSESRNSFQSY